MFKLYRPNLPEQVINLLALRFAPVVVPEASSECNFGKLSMISQISNFSSVFFFKGLSFQTDQSAPFVNESYCMTHTILLMYEPVPVVSGMNLYQHYCEALVSY